MIQRIQTLFWVLALGCLVAFGLIPYANLITPQGEFTLSIMGFTANANGESMFHSYPLLALVAIAALLLVITIFQYKHRGRQIHLSIYSAILEAGASGLALYYLFAAKQPFQAVEVIAGIVICLPLVSAVFTLLGMRWVRLDIAFLKRMNRLR